MKNLWIAAFLFLAAAAIPTLAQAEGSTPPGDLTGQWVLNQSQSTDLAATTRQGMSGRSGGRGGQGGGMGRGGMGGGMGRGGRGGPPGGGGRGSQGEGPSSQAQKHLEEMQKQIARLDIYQEGDELNLTNGLDITQLIYTDGRIHKIWTQRGEVEATSHWDEGVLVLSIQNPRHPEPHVRRFALSEDGSQLTVSEERPVPGQENPVTFKLVYDRK